MPYTYRPEKIYQIVKSPNLSDKEIFLLLGKTMPDAGLVVLLARMTKDEARTEVKKLLIKLGLKPEGVDFLFQDTLGTTEDGWNHAVDIVASIPTFLPSHFAQIIRAIDEDVFEIAAHMNGMEPYFIELDSEEKVRSYFSDLSKTKEFDLAIKSIRKSNGIPWGGFTDVDKWWDFRTNSGKASDIELEAKKLVTKYEFGPEWLENIINYIELDSLLDEKWPQSSLIGVEDERALWYDGKDLKEDDMLNSSRPVSIRISPYATQRDILDYVKKMYTFTIAEKQLKYRKDDAKLAKVRSRDTMIQERNDIVYHYRNLPHKEILKKLPKNMRDTLDEGSIGKIISIENEKRN